MTAEKMDELMVYLLVAKWALKMDEERDKMMAVSMVDKKAVMKAETMACLMVEMMAG